MSLIKTYLHNLQTQTMLPKDLLQSAKIHLSAEDYENFKSLYEEVNKEKEKNKSVFAIHVTERITTSYEFDSEEEAKEALESMDFMLHESEVICGEVLNTEIVELN